MEPGESLEAAGLPTLQHLSGSWPLEQYPLHGSTTSAGPSPAAQQRKSARSPAPRGETTRGASLNRRGWGGQKTATEEPNTHQMTKLLYITEREPLPGGPKCTRFGVLGGPLSAPRYTKFGVPGAPE